MLLSVVQTRASNQSRDGDDRATRGVPCHWHRFRRTTVDGDRLSPPKDGRSRAMARFSNGKRDPRCELASRQKLVHTYLSDDRGQPRARLPRRDRGDSFFRTSWRKPWKRTPVRGGVLLPRIPCSALSSCAGAVTYRRGADSTDGLKFRFVGFVSSALP